MDTNQDLSTVFQSGSGSGIPDASPPSVKKKSRRGGDPANQKRRCISTACIACRRRKSKCDGAIPSCAACASVYGTECVYDPNSDHRRKGVYREKVDCMKAQSSTLQILIEAILNATEDEVPAVVKQIRTCDSLDTVAESILRREQEQEGNDDDDRMVDEFSGDLPVEGERDLARKMGELRLENGSVRFIGGTSHLIYLGDPSERVAREDEPENYQPSGDPVTSWTTVTKDPQLVIHLINMYFAWHYPFFTCLSKSLFYRDFVKGKPVGTPKGLIYCSSLLVNAMLALGCHFTSDRGAFGTAGDARTKGDHFFAEAKRLIIENDEYEKPRLVTVQALALMSVREAGCAREAKGWVYSGMSFRMAQDLGLNLNVGGLSSDKDHLNEHEIDARRMTFWGCFLFDKCWSNYLGRLPQLPKDSYNVSKYDVFPDEDSEMWSPYTDSGSDQSSQQPSRTRAIGLQFLKLLEISSDLLLFFYHPNHIGRSSGKSVELKKLSELHRRLEDWRKELPKEFEPRDGQLPNVILVHMFFHTQFIHLFRPFLKYTPSASPLPNHVSPRRNCTAHAGAISKLMRLYKKTWNMRQIPNIAVYMLHSACTIHLLNLPDKSARRDIIHGVKHLEEIAEDWLCARRTLSILSVLARKWNVELPEEASMVLKRTDEKYGTFSTSDVPSPRSGAAISSSPSDLATSPQSAATPPKPESYSPMGQLSAPQSPQEIQRGSPDVMMPNATMAAMNSALLTKQQMQPQLSVTSMPLQLGSESLAGGNSWNEVTTTQPLSNYQQFRTVQHANISSRTTSQSATRQVSPSTQIPDMTVDPQNWFLNEGVRWHQNFEAWNMPRPTVSRPEGSQSRPQPMNSNLPNSPLFMFQGGHMRPRSEDGIEAFDTLGTTFNDESWLNGLD